MFHHVKELQFNARVSKPDVPFAKLLLEQFGGPNRELKAAMQYFVQAFGCRKAFPDKSNQGTKASMKSSQLLKLSDVAMEAIIVGAAV
jgi:Mn-containing catalase